MTLPILNHKNFKSVVLESTEPVLFFFGAAWNRNCKMLCPIIEKIAEEKASPLFYQIDIDKSQDIAAYFHVAVLPMLILVQNGKIIQEAAGTPTRHEILKMLNCGKNNLFF